MGRRGEGGRGGKRGGDDDRDRITFGARDGGRSSALGSKVAVEGAVDGGLVLTDGAVTEMQTAREMKRKAAKDKSFIFFILFLCQVL